MISKIYHAEIQLNKANGSYTEALVLSPSVFFFKNLSICLSVMLSPPKTLDKIQPNFMRQLLTWMGRAIARYFCPAPWALGKDQKVKYHKISLQSQLHIFKPNYTTYQNVFCPVA